MITRTVIAGQTWTIIGDDRPNPLSPTPRITATVNGATVDLNCQYRQITSIEHAAGCTWGVDLSPICTCAPQPGDAEALFAAARDVLRQCSAARETAEAAENQARQARLDADGSEMVVRLPAGCEGCPSAIYGGVCTCC